MRILNATMAGLVAGPLCIGSQLAAQAAAPITEEAGHSFATSAQRA